MIVESLVDAGYKVTVLTRSSSQKKHPSDVEVVQVDYEDKEALTQALRGHDVVISTIGYPAFLLQQTIIDAAIAAGVKRFIPSEWGSDTTNPNTRVLPGACEKAQIQEYLLKKANEGQIDFTLIFTGPFLDFCLRVGFLMDLKGHTVDLYDGGDVLFSTTNTSSVGKGVVEVLRQGDNMKNRTVYMEDIALTQNKLVQMVEELSGREFKKKIVNTKEMEEAAYAEAKKENPVPWNIYNFIKLSIWREGFGGHFAQTDSETLKIGMTEEDVKQTVAKILADSV